MTRSKIEYGDMARPLLVAIGFTFIGELLVFVVWGLWWFPASGPLWSKAGWTAICGVAMGAVVGAVVILLVSGRMSGARAAWAAGSIYFAILAACAGLCWRIDLALGYFGGQSHPWRFLLGGWLPAAATAFVYGWLTFGGGRRILSKILASSRVN